MTTKHQNKSGSAVNPTNIMEAVAMYSLLGKDRDLVIELMNKYGEDITLNDLFKQICTERNNNLKIIFSEFSDEDIEKLKRGDFIN